MSARSCPSRSPSRLATIACLCTLCAGVPALAQQGDEQPAPLTPEQLADRPIRRVTFRRPVRGSDPVRYEPLSDEMLGLAENFTEVRPGDLYDPEKISADIATLNRLGAFGEITAHAEILPDGGLDLIYTLEPVPVIRDIQIPANTTVSARDIAEVVDLLKGGPANRLALDRAARAIEDLYREKGYPNVTVTWDESELEDKGIVYFQIVEGSRVKVTDIRFEFLGTQSFPPGRLKGQIQTRPAGILEKGRLDEQQLIEDANALIEFYQNQGFMDVRVEPAPPRISPNGREAIVTFLIEEGPRYTLRNIQVFYPNVERRIYSTRQEAQRNAQEGEEIVALDPGQYAVFRPEPFSSAQIAGLLPIKRGDVFSMAEIRRGLARIEAAFGELGHVDVRQDTATLQMRQLRVPEEPGHMDLLLIINPGKRYRAGQIIIQGNDQTQQGVILHEVEVRPDRPLSASDIRKTEIQLRRSRLFNTNPRDGILPQVTVQREDPDMPGYRDVLIEVQETATRSFNLGGAISSDLGATARLSITERNFDLFDWPDSLGEFLRQRSFRGAGQTFSINIAPGTELQTYSVSLADPTLLDTDYSASGLVQFRTRRFREFDEERLGGRFGFGRAFGRRWSGQIAMRAERVTISDIEEDNPVDFFDVEGSNTITSATFQLVRNTTDSRIIPSRGSRTRIAIEQAGILGGDYTFTSLRAEHAVFITLFEDYDANRTILELRAEAGWIPQGNDEAPVFERFYRGGRSFRGFDFRTISPKGIRNDTGELGNDPIGGSWEFFLGAELTQPVFEDILAVAFFVDSGTVQEDLGFDEYRVSAGAGVRLVTPLSPAPIALDFGVPLLKEDGDETRLLTFTIDIPF